MSRSHLVDPPLPARSRWQALLLRTALLLAACLGSATAFAGTAGAATYYVDCSAGSDSRAGTSTSAAWRSLTKANGASLRAGDSLLLKSGCQFGPAR